MTQEELAAHIDEELTRQANGYYKDENGNDDEEKYQLAAAMLAYINASSVGMNDGMDYVEECLNATECRSIFKMIFDAMKQKQHYDMMMDTSSTQGGR